MSFAAARPFVLSAFALVAGFLALPAAAADRGPTLTAVRASVTLKASTSGVTGDVAARIDFCAEIGPRAALLVRETKRVGATTRAARAFARKLASSRPISSYRCVRRHVVRWDIASWLLRGEGTYAVNVRVRDARGRITESLGFSVPR